MAVIQSHQLVQETDGKFQLGGCKTIEQQFKIDVNQGGNKGKDNLFV